MDIAIVAPSPVPFAVGGAESLFSTLHRYVNGSTPHHGELIKLPSPESDFPSLIASYESFSALDLSHFDVVITTKYPAWMVRHPAQTLYLQHKLRGLYDTYHLTGLPSVAAPSPGLKKLRTTMRGLSGDPTAHGRLPEFFARLRELMERDPEALRFPGPVAREVIHFLDDVGLAPSRVRTYAAISETVRRREHYFPPSRDVGVCPHPSGLDGFRCGGDEYLFTVARLDGPKRVAMLIDAMRFVKADIPLLIAGTGPEERHLRKLAAGDSRIRFLGFVNDAQLVDLYADALAVLYVPFEEDYGLVTIEAMMSSKPVITATDSGGVNEFVRDGETGYSVPPDPEAIASRIDHICGNRSEAGRMGIAGRRIAETITWDRVVTTLLSGSGREGATRPRPGKQRRKRLVVTTTFPVYPPRGGGQARVFHLYRELARDRDVHIISLGAPHEPEQRREVAPGLWEVRVPRSAEHEEREQALSRTAGNLPVTDVAMLLLHALTPAYGRALLDSVDGARAVVASHPYTLGAIRAAAADVPLWYEAHNVELELKRRILESYAAAAPLLRATERAEAECWRSAELVYGCSARDLEILGEIYGATAAERLEVPNGVDLRTTKYFPPGDRASLKDRLGFGVRPVAVFLGSWHQPNLEAVEQILRLAERLPEVVFLIVGSVGGPFEYALPPRNVVVTGVVEDGEKNLLLGCADLALNPMISGSGTNLKMLDYFAAGTPVLSTPLGARGLKVTPGEHLLIADLEDFGTRVTELLDDGFASCTDVVAAAVSLAENEYSWTVIANRFAESLEQRIERRPVAMEQVR